MRNISVVVGMAVVIAIVGTSSCSRRVSDEDTRPATVENLDRDPFGLSEFGFTDVTNSAGLGQVQSPRALSLSRTMSAGVAVADINSDGFDDVLLTRAGMSDLLYLNQGDGTFEDVSRSAGISGPAQRYGSSAAVFLDADGDGHLDLFRTGFGRGENTLYMNTGDGKFVDQTDARGLSQSVPGDVDFVQMHGATVADVNGDGYMDLLVLQWFVDPYPEKLLAEIERVDSERRKDGKSPMRACELREMRDELVSSTPGGERRSLSALYINDGSGRFEDRTEEFGLALDDVIAFTGVFHDMNGDGWPDLAITGDGCTSKLYINEGGLSFIDVTGESGVGTDENGMGSLVRDFNSDGSPDWLISSISYGRAGEPCPVGGLLDGCSGNRMYINNGDAEFTDQTDAFGLRDGGWGWGIAAENFANTRTLQIAMTNGFSTGVPRSAASTPEEVYIASFESDRTRFWAQAVNGDLPYENVANAVGITDDGLGRGMVAFDIDNDGDLDLLIAVAGAEPILYRNDLNTNAAWLTVRLDDPTTPGNRWADGARIEIVAREGDDPVVGWIGTGGSYESQKPPLFHAGLGDLVDNVVQVSVYWPHDDQPQVVRDVSPDQRLTVSRTRS